MRQLKDYRNKRNFQQTPEPAGADQREPIAGGNLFVVQKHAAQRLHYDFRLEQDGVLKSWALPRGISLRPGEKRLAVQVEDHPLEYGDFEGVIPKKEYGGGTVMVWDRGRWQPATDNAKDDRIDFVLDGQKLHGSWTLARMSGRGNENGKNWLLIRRRSKSNKDKAFNDDESVLSGRSMTQIAKARDRVWSGRKETDAVLPDPAKLEAAHKRPLPADPQPQLASLSRRTPDGVDWVHEIKLDGYRILAQLESGEVRLLTRNGKNWSDRFHTVAKLLEQLPAKQALLDGEIVALAADGTTSFHKLQEALSNGRTEGLVYQVFDLLHLNGYDLTDVALLERKQLLAQLLKTARLDGNTIRFTEHLATDGSAMFQQACRLGLEGIISKRGASRYRSGRSRDWLKVKCIRQEEFVIGGYTDPGGSRSGFGALLLGAYNESKEFIYCGRVGTGFNERELHSLHAVLNDLQQTDSPFAGPVPDARSAHWVQPQQVIEVEFSQWTRDGRLRQPAFRGLREDLDADEIQLPSVQAVSKSAIDSAPARPARRKTRSRTGKMTVAGVKITHPERIVYSEQGVTKLQLARYYEEISHWILPHLASRPLSLLRCPEGSSEECFFQKHPRQTISGSVPRVQIEEKKGVKSYVYVQSAADIVALVQVGVLEFHPWGSCVDDVERPDTLIFDLDPAPGVDWPEVLRIARELRDRLENLGLTAFARITGGKGLHLVVPITPRDEWSAVKAFAHAVSERHARDDRQWITLNMSKSKRRGKIFLDYLRNGRGATAIASYSTRARPGAPVAVPVRWDELGPALHSDRYNVDNLRRRLAALRADPWEGFADARRPVTRQMRLAVGLK